MRSRSHPGEFTHMGRIIVTEFVSLDGVMEAPGGGEDYKHAGWTFEISRGEEGNAFKLKETFDFWNELLRSEVVINLDRHGVV